MPLPNRARWCASTMRTSIRCTVHGAAAYKTRITSSAMALLSRRDKALRRVQPQHDVDALSFAHAF